MGFEVRSRALHRAAVIVGTRRKLRELLSVSMHDLDSWMTGEQPTPLHIFLQAVDLISAAAAVQGRAGTSVESILAEAVGACGGSMATLQVVRSEGLVVVGHRGFEQPFLDHFSCVTHQGSCGAAVASGGRIIVRDVQSDPIFAGTPAAPVMAEANAHAVQSTPLLSPAGSLVGMLSTHFDRPHQPTGRELDAIDDIARRAAYWLDGRPL